MIYLCEYDGYIKDDILQEFAEKLPFSLPNGCKSGIRWSKARQRILAWLLLDYALCANEKQKAVPGEMIQRLAIERNEFGKPFSGRRPDLQFNLSHCEAGGACTVDSKPVGIDVERRFSYRENLERGMCHVNEIEALKKMEQEERHRQQQILWSLKESYVKRDGRGLGYGLKNIDFSQYLPITEKRKILYLKNGCEDYRSDGVIQFESGTSYTLAFCGWNEQRCVKVSEQELELWIKHK